MRHIESVFACLMSWKILVWIGLPLVENKFKRSSVEQLESTCYCYFFYYSRNPQFWSLVHSKILISCCIKYHAYIFFHSINLLTIILCLYMFYLDCNYFMLSQFCLDANIGKEQRHFFHINVIEPFETFPLKH